MGHTGVKHYKIWQAPVLAFFSTKFYRDLGANGKGVGFVYLLALLSVSCLVEPVRQFISLHEFMGSRGKEVAAQFPTMKIEDGRLSIDEQSPYVISVGDNALITFYADEKALSEMPEDDASPIIVTPTELSMRMSTTDTTRLPIPFKGVHKYSLNKNDIERMFAVSCFTAPTVIYLFKLPAAWLGHILQALIYSVVALLVAKLINVECKYEGLLRVSSVAVGCSVILGTITQLIPVQFPGVNEAGGLLAQILIAGGYTMFGTGANLSQPAFVPVNQETGGAGESS